MTSSPTPVDVTPVIGAIPFRIALAGGWIDQPFVSRLNPDGVGSMVVAQVHPDIPIMPRSGLATGTRKIAQKVWGHRLPDREPAQLVKELYRVENDGRQDPSGSQDMIGLIYPGITRIDYDFRHDGGVFPSHLERCTDPAVAAWLSRVIHVIAVAPRPLGYSPLGVQNLDPKTIARLGRSGRDCYDAILRRDIHALGASMNDCSLCWDALLPHVYRHPSVELDLLALRQLYADRHPGAMFSGCGGGYLYVASETPVAGAFNLRVRV